MEQSDILRNLRIEQLTPMQEAARDAYQSDKDLVLLSPTGSGKTLAFLLPLVQSLKADVQGVQAVVLVPSRELALQIENVFKSMNVPFKAMSCYGGRPAMDEHRTMKGINPAVIIGTPGRMNDHLRKQNFDTRFVTTLVIDEFDKCLEFGFHDEMAEVIGQLPALKKRVLLSATDAEEIPQFTGVGGVPNTLNFFIFCALEITAFTLSRYPSIYSVLISYSFASLLYILLSSEDRLSRCCFLSSSVCPASSQ